MKLNTALIAAAALVALPLAAQAQPINGLYVSGGLGANIQQGEKFNNAFGGGTARTNPDLAAQGSVGFGLGNGLRLEVEGDFLGNTLKGGLHGDDNKFGIMGNVLYDFSIGSPLVPYVGGGVGYQEEHITGAGTKGAFAYQGILGAAWPIASVPGLAATLEYRFLGLDGRRNYAGFSTDQDYNHTFLIGLRYAFGAPAMTTMATVATATPAPVAAPAPAPARTYLVFFDWDRADLTARAKTIIADAASASTRVAVVKIEVNGNADLSGTPQYNQGLSLRRAQMVASELVRDGVKQGLIDIHAYGDTRPLVPTARGVREPQNRRVEIVFH